MVEINYIDDKKISFLLNSSGSEKKFGKNVAALQSPFFSTKCSGTTATDTRKVTPL